jgi:hypothetical protein
MKRFVAYALSIVLLAPVLGGCGTATPPGGVKTVKVTVLPSGKVSVHGGEMDVDHLGSRLRSMGVSRDTVIELTIPENEPPAALAPISKNLVGAGYRRMIFVKPQKITVSTPP